MSAILSDITAKRNLGGESIVVALGAEIPVVIGPSLGANTPLSAAETIVHNGTSQKDSLAKTGVRKITWVNTANDNSGRLYTEGVHFVLSSDELDWSNAPVLAPPAIDTLEVLSSGGSFSSTGDYAYAISCVDGDGEETLVGTPFIAHVTATTQSVKIIFAKPAGAVGSVRIYRTTNITNGVADFSASGSTSYFTTALTTFTDTGTSGTTSAAKSTTSAKDRPGDSDTYYVMYDYAVFAYNTPKLYANTDAIINDHGMGSVLTNAGIMAIGRNGKGNAAPAVVLVAVEKDEVSYYQEALTTLESYPYGNYIVCMKHNDVLDESGKSHASLMSQDSKKKERFYVSCPLPDIALGDESTPGTVIHKVKSYLGEKRVIVPVLEGNRYTINQLQQTDGSYLYNQVLTNAQYFAVAVAAQKCAQPDVAEDLTGKQIVGFNFPDINPHWSTVEKENLVSAGGMLIVDSNGAAVVNRAITCSLASNEDQTISVLSTEDELRRQCRNSAKPFIGKKITDARVKSFRSYVKKLLDLFVQKELITTFTDLETFADENNAQKLVARFRYKPMWSSIWVEFNYGFIPTN